MPTPSDRPWVLVTGPDQSRAALAAVRLLDRAGCRPAVTVTGRASLAASSRYCRRRVSVPDADTDPSGYASAVRAELARRNYLTVLPGSDSASIALERPEAHFMNKVHTAQLAAEVGLEVPPSFVFESYADLRAAGPDLPYPIIVKPETKRFLAQRADRPEDLARVSDGPGALIVQPFLTDDLHGLLGLMWRGQLVAAVHFRYLRLWPLPAGTVAAAETSAHDPDLEGRFEHLLAGYDGLFHADLAGPYLLDLNPRIHATLPLAASAGADIVAAYCDLLRGGSPRVMRGRPGVRFQWLEGDLRSLIRAVREGRMSLGRALREGRPRRGTVHSLESLRDPRPFFERFRFLRRDLETRQTRRRGERRRAEIAADAASRHT
jgi:hypothetical protein